MDSAHRTRRSSSLGQFSRTPHRFGDSLEAPLSSSNDISTIPPSRGVSLEDRHYAVGSPTLSPHHDSVVEIARVPGRPASSDALEHLAVEADDAGWPPLPEDLLKSPVRVEEAARFHVPPEERLQVVRMEGREEPVASES